MSNKIQSNYPGWTFNNIPPQSQLITFRTSPVQGDDPITWQELDNNFEIFRYTINEVIDELNALDLDNIELRISQLEAIDTYTKVESDAKYALIGASYTKSEADTRFAPVADYALASDITPHVDAYTKTESDSRYQASGNYALASDIVDSYTKTESDTRYQAAGNYALASDITDHVDAYTKTESDNRYQAAGSYALSTDIIDSYTKTESDNRYALIGTTGGGGGTSWENVEVQPAQGELNETSDAIIEQIASDNVIALRNAIAEALCDNSTAATQPQTFTGCVRLPAGRIYLNERIVITMPATLGHNLPNSITIEGVGQGNTQLCWTNSATSYGILIEQGPYGATMSQRIIVRDLDFIMGNQGLDADGNGVGVPTNQSEGLLYARGTALEVTGDRLDIGISGASSTHAQLTGYDKTPGHGLKPNTIVENCNFMGWHFSYAGWDKCIVYEDSQISDIKGCCFTGAIIDTGDGKPWATSTSAIHITGDAKCTDYYLTENRFFGFEYGILCNGNIEGVTIQHSTWVNTHHGIWWAVEKIGGGQPAYDPETNSFTSGSTDGTSIEGVAQWPLLVVTDCHINALETCIHIHNGWQVMIKGCSFYGINIAQAYGAEHGFDAYHRSIYIDNQSSNVIVTANTFSDTSNTTSLRHGAYGPSIEIDGHFNVVDGNTFNRDGNRDEPHVKMTARASGNTIINNVVITSLAQNWADGGVPTSVTGFTMHIEDNNVGSYNGIAIHQNRIGTNY